MAMKVRCGVLAGVMVALAIPVCAQSLGDLAKKEQDRRKTTPAAKKVYTNDDLKKIAAAAGITDAPSAPTDPAKPGEPAAQGGAPKSADGAKAADQDKPAANESEWRNRMNAAREALRRNEAFRDALQSRINGLTADFTARDDPYQRAQIADDRQKALAELEHVTKDIASSKKAIDDIEEEARRANVPPGWIR
jgi:hypothetical protein